MKLTMKNSALLATAILTLGTASTVAATTASTTGSTGKVEFIHDDSEPTNPLDPNDPDNQDPTSPIDPDDPDNNGTGNKGPLTIDYVSNINFGKAKVGAKTMTLDAINKTPYVQVSDWRDSDAGWTLSAEMTKAFTNTRDGSVIDGAVMQWSKGELKKRSANESAAPTASDFSLNKGGAITTVMSANASQKAGHGTWLDVFDGTHSSSNKSASGQEVLGNNNKVTLTVPTSQVEDGVYNAEITWSLSDTPK